MMMTLRRGSNPVVMVQDTVQEITVTAGKHTPPMVLMDYMANHKLII